MSDPDVLPITQCGDPVLRRPAEPVDPADLGTSELQRLIAAMRATMEAAPGVGLAAVVARHRAVQVEALDEHGQPIDRVFSGWPARIVQHEADHLGGRLYLDRAETRSLCTADNYAQFWAGRPLGEIGASLGFTLR